MAVAVQNNITTQITKSVALLTPEQQKQLMKEINNMMIMNEAHRLQGSVKPGGITMEEIVAETKAARKERDKKNAKK